MLKNEDECPNININAQNSALMIKNEHLCPTFEHLTWAYVRVEHYAWIEHHAQVEHYALLEA